MDPIDEDQVFHECVAELVKASCRALKKLPYRSPEYDRLSEAIANVEPFYESQDPQQMGWVGSNGLP